MYLLPLNNFQSITVSVVEKPRGQSRLTNYAILRKKSEELNYDGEKRGGIVLIKVVFLNEPVRKK